MGIWVAFLSRYALPKWLEKATWVNPGAIKGVVNLAIGLTFGFVVIVFGIGGLVFIVTVIVTLVLVFPFLDSVDFFSSQ